MNAQNLAQILHALEVIHSQSSTNAARKQAELVLEDLKQQLPATLAYAFHILNTQETPPHAKQFSLHFIEHAIKNQWQTYSSAMREDLKYSVLSMLDIPNLDKQPKFIKEKLSKVIAEVALREWPQQWPDLLSKLHEFSRKGLAEELIFVMVLRNLSELCTDYEETIPNTRRKELLDGLQFGLADIIPIVMKILQESKNQDFLLVTLQLLNTFLTWMPIKIIINNKLFELMLKQLYSSVSTPNYAIIVDCISLLLTKKSKSTDTNYTLYLLQSFQSLLHFVAHRVDLIKNKNLDFEDSKFEIQLVQSVCDFALDSIFNDQTNNFDISISKVLCEFIVHLLQSQTIQIWSCALAVSVSILKNNKYKNLLLDNSQWFLQFCVDKLVRKNNKDFDQEFFDTYDDYVQLFGAIKTYLITVIKIITDFNLTQSIQVMISWIQQILNKINNSELYNANSLIYLEFEGLINLTEAVLSSAIKSLDKLSDLEKKKMLDILLLVINKNLVDAILCGRQLALIQCFSFAILTDDNLLKAYLNKILQIIKFKHVNSTTDLVANAEEKATRRKACTTLIKLAVDGSQKILPLFETLFNFTKETDLTFEEKCFMNEVLVIISNSIDKDQQLYILKLILSPLLDNWRELLRSYNLKNLNLNSNEQIGFILHCFTAMFSRLDNKDSTNSQNIYNYFIVSLLPDLYILVDIFNTLELDNNTNFKTIPQKEQRAIFGYTYQANFNITQDEKLVQIYYTLREDTYKLLGLFLNKCPLVLDNKDMLEIIQKILTFNTQNYTLMHNKQLNKNFLQVIFKVTPKYLFDTFFNMDIINSINSKTLIFKNLWKIEFDKLVQEKKILNSIQSPEDEILNDIILRQSTRDFLTTFNAFVNVDFKYKVGAVKAANTLEEANGLTDLGLYFIINHMHLLVQVLSVGLESLDSSSCHSSIILGIRIFSSFKNISISDTLFIQLIDNILKGLTIHGGHNECLPDIITLLARILSTVIAQQDQNKMIQLSLLLTDKYNIDKLLVSDILTKLLQLNSLGEKKAKDLVKQMLKSIIGTLGGLIAQKNIKNIHDLPNQSPFTALKNDQKLKAHLISDLIYSSESLFE